MLAFTIVVALIIGTLGAFAQDGSGEAPAVDQALFDQGEELYRANCVICHQNTGAGNPPTFPALAGNENLQNLDLIVLNIHQGQNAMPPFPQFDATQVAALATYVRNAWDNAFGGVDVGQVEEILAAASDDEVTRSIWDGVYTQEQAERGEPLYSRCAECHGVRRLGAHPSLPAFLFRADREPDGPVLMHVTNPGQFDIGPPLGGRLWFRDWAGNTLGAFYLVASTTMPLDLPGSLPDQDYIDIIAFLLASSDVPAGDEELPPDVDVLNNIIIEPPAED
jgi:mono/diheme cytochrome c family protein